MRVLPAAHMPRTDTTGSAPLGYCDAPATLAFVPSRITVPPAQRRPSPNPTPAPPEIVVEPWKYSAELFGICEPCSTSESFEMLAEPLPSILPPWPNEFRQP